MANYQSGSYDFVGSMISAFRAPGIERHQITQFREILISLDSATATPSEADGQIQALGGEFSKLWSWLNANGTAIQTIVAVIALFLLIYYESSGGEDAQEYQSELERNTEVERLILQELRKQSDADNLYGSTTQPKTEKKETRQPQMPPLTLNRHERRKQQALGRKA